MKFCKIYSFGLNKKRLHLVYVIVCKVWVTLKLSLIRTVASCGGEWALGNKLLCLFVILGSS